MKVINGIIHYTPTEVSQLCGVSTQTIKLVNKEKKLGRVDLSRLPILSQTVINTGVLKILRKLWSMLDNLIKRDMVT